MTSHDAMVDDVTIRWEEHGHGMPVVLGHGIPTSPALWRHVVPRLDGMRILSFEMVGYGHSIATGRNHDISVAAQARHLNAWLDHLDVDRAVLAGHDLGGGVVHIAAVERPQRCAGLMLTNAIAYDSWPIPSIKALRATRTLFARAPDTLLKTRASSSRSRQPSADVSSCSTHVPGLLLVWASPSA